MPRYVRYRVEGGTYFFTVTLLERRRSLLTDHVDLLRACFAQVRRRRPFDIDAMVVLPDHLHCIWTLPPGDSDFSGRWQAIKAGFARELPPVERLSRRRRLKGERGIWQRRFWEHAIRNERDWANHVDYIHFNPVKHGLVRRPADWPHSSFHRFVREGRYSSDWTGCDEFERVRRDISRRAGGAEFLTDLARPIHCLDSADPAFPAGKREWRWGCTKRRDPRRRATDRICRC